MTEATVAQIQHLNFCTTHCRYNCSQPFCSTPLDLTSMPPSYYCQVDTEEDTKAHHPNCHCHFPITINIKLGINQIEPRPNSTFLRLGHLIEDLCFNDEMSDCRIICEDQIFPCHKFILSVRSDVFKTMFQTMDMQEGLYI